MSSYNDYNDYNEDYHEEEDYDESGSRSFWAILTWICTVLTILLNIVLIAILVIRRNIFNHINKGICLLALVDLLYGLLVLPFFTENYVDLHWNQSQVFCKFYEFYFTFHDFIVPITLILLSTYICLKFSGLSSGYESKNLIYLVLGISALVLSILLALPATFSSAMFIDNKPGAVYKQECRSLDTYSMTIMYTMSSSLLFCFTMSFLFSLCIVGSPLLKETYDQEEYNQRWRFLLTISIVNALYIVTGFLLNFKEVSRHFLQCCNFEEPFRSTDSLTYDIWSFTLLASETWIRPLANLVFYFRYIINDISAY